MNHDYKNAAFLYSLCLLHLLLATELLAEGEYHRIAALSQEHYGVKIYV